MGKRLKKLGGLAKKMGDCLDRHFTAIAYAEAGDYKTAREILANGEPSNPRRIGFSNRFDRHLVAITYAEAGEHETAREILNEDEGSSPGEDYQGGD